MFSAQEAKQLTQKNDSDADKINHHNSIVLLKCIEKEIKLAIKRGIYTIQYISSFKDKRVDDIVIDQLRKLQYKASRENDKIFNQEEKGITISWA